MFEPCRFFNDGLMDLCIIKKISRINFLSLVSYYKNGTYLDKPKALKYIEYRQVSHFKMVFPAPLPICIDGEIKGAKTIDFSVVKDGFRFVVPKGCELKYKTPEDCQARILD